MEKICANIIENNFGNHILKEKFLFYLFNKQEINHFFLNLIMKYPFIIRNIDNPTEEMKLLAVKNNGYAIKYINDPTEEMKIISYQNRF